MTMTVPMSMADATEIETVLDQPLVAFGPEVCGDLAAGLRREWLVTNGLGGYASSTLAGVATRSYHGLLVAALEPPVARTVLVGALDAWATYDGVRYPLSTHEFGADMIAPEGFRQLAEFRLDGTLPVWRWALADAIVEQRLWMPHGRNTTFVTYRLERASLPVALDLTPLTTYRTFHALSRGANWEIAVALIDRGVTIHPYDGATPFHLQADRGRFDSAPGWWWDFRYREESARGLQDHGDLFAPGAFHATLEPGETLTLTFTIESDRPIEAEASLAAERARQQALLVRAATERADPVVQQLVLAADQFIVRRGQDATPQSADSTLDARTVIAGYHWFNDWGRDTMIALPGLTLATGRPDDAAGILRTFAAYLADGLLPNNFPDRAGVIPGYNTADATLWYVLAIRAYREATRDDRLVDDLLPALHEIVARHVAGTRYGIGVDPSDGLLRAGEPGVQLTWMDAKVGDWVVTPRIGKPVEINALWYNVLRAVSDFLTNRGEDAADLLARADRLRASFLDRFLNADGDALADVIDGPDGDDWSFRPNQLLALSLPYSLLTGDDARRVLANIGRQLITAYGPRSLSPRDSDYRGDYGGDQLRRDGGYHQGPVWPWLMGAYVEAHARLHGDRGAALDLLRPVVHHLRDAGLGSISEILEGDAPHLPRGCIAQAWSVAEILRVWRLLA